MPAVLQARTSDSDSDCVAPSHTSVSSAYSALARRGFKKVQKALAKRRCATSFTNLVTMLRGDRPPQPDLLSPEDAPLVEQCPEPDYKEGMMVAPESPTKRLFTGGALSETVSPPCISQCLVQMPALTAGRCPTLVPRALCGLAMLACDTLDKYINT